MRIKKKRRGYERSSITTTTQRALAPRNLDWVTENDTPKLTTVCLLYVKGLVKKIQKICSPYDISTIFRAAQLFKIPLLSQTPNRIQYDQELCILHPIPVVLKYTKVKLKKHWKAVYCGEIEKSGMADHIWKEKGNCLSLWDEVKIIPREEHWRIRCVKEPTHMLGYSDLLSRTSLKLYMIWEPLIEMSRLKKKLQYEQSFKKIIHGSE